MIEFKRRRLPENGPECDAEYLYVLAELLLNDDEYPYKLDGVDQDLRRTRGKPVLLYLGRTSTDAFPDFRLITGRSAVKRMLKGDQELYKAVRHMMMKYEMGAEVPVMAVGADENISLGIITLVN